MKRASFLISIVCLLLHVQAQAQTNSIMTGTVTHLHWRALGVKGDDGRTFHLRVGWRTAYSNGFPAVGDKIRVEYAIVRRVYAGYSVTILNRIPEDIKFQKTVAKKGPPLPSSFPLEIADLAGRWEGSWDNNENYGFTLTISNINLKSEVAEVQYESEDLQFFKKANVIPGEKPRIQWVLNSVVNPEGPFASPTKDRIDIITESMVIYYTCELQKDRTLKGTFDSQRISPLGTSRIAILRKVN